MKHMYEAYAAATHTVANTQQIVMLYDGAIRNLQQAKDAMQANEIEQRYHLLVKTSDIVFGLQGCLDFDRGGEVATALYNFYSSIDRRIFALHHSNDAGACAEVVADLKSMRDVWDEIDKASAAEQQAQMPDSASTVAEAPDVTAPKNIPAPEGDTDSGEGIVISV